MAHEYGVIVVYKNRHTLVKPPRSGIRFLWKIVDGNGRLHMGSDEVVELSTSANDLVDTMMKIDAYHHIKAEWDAFVPPGNYPSGGYLTADAKATFWLEGEAPEIVFSDPDEFVFLNTLGGLGWEPVEFNGMNLMRKQV